MRIQRLGQMVDGNAPTRLGQVAGGGNGGGGPTTLIEDAFTDTDTTALSAHAIAPTNTPSTSWANIKILTSASAANNTISSNQALLSIGQTGAVVDAGEADVTVTVDWIPQSGNNRGRLIGRYSSDGNMWYVAMNEFGDDIAIYEVNADVEIERGTAVAFDWVDLTTYEVQLIMSGTSFEALVDSVSKVTHSSSVFQTETQHGIGRGAGVAQVYDNCTVVTG